jgi:hypothetical protein
MGSVEFFVASQVTYCGGSLMKRMELMSEFPVFGSGDDFLRYMEQLVEDIREGRVEDPPYHAVFLANRAEAEESLSYHRAEAVRLGFNPDRVVMLRDPTSDDWVVLIPRVQDDAAFEELWGHSCDG